MERLTDKGYWDRKYDEVEPARPLPRAPTRGFKAVIKRLLGPRVAEYMRDYCEYLLWDVLYKDHLATTIGARVLEVGSAPGEHLVRLAKVFGYEPFGVEYSEQGAHLNRALFQGYGIDPDHVIQGDFFSPKIQERYQDHFDVVVSRGFIEHFTDPRATIERHLNVLRVGGRLVVTIPNLSGMNYWLLRFFYKEIIPLHNLAIMQLDAFQDLFRSERLTTLKCGYYGTFNFGIFFAKPGSPKRHLLPLLAKLQRLMNLAFRTAFADKGAEHRYFSPYLIFIGVKNR